MTLTGTPTSRLAAFVFGIAAGLWLRDLKPCDLNRQPGDSPIRVWSGHREAFRFGLSPNWKWRIVIRNDKRVRVKREVRT